MKDAQKKDMQKNVKQGSEAAPFQGKPGEKTVLHYEDVGVPNSIFRLAMKTFFGWFIQGLETNGLREYVKQRGSGQGRAKGKPASEEEETGAAHGRRWGWVRRLRPLGVVATTLVLAGKGARPRRRASTAV